MLGEIPAGTHLKAYWKLESDGTDSSGNAFDLTNNNSVSFNQSKFSNGADFGSSGTNKGLTNTGYPTSLRPIDLQLNIWFKLNSTANITARRLFQMTSSTTYAGGGVLFYLEYNITNGVLTFTGRMYGQFASISPPLDTDYHFISLRYYNVSGTRTLTVQMDERLGSTYNNTSTATGTPNFTGATVGTVIGNNQGLTIQAFAKIDECFLREDQFFRSTGDASGNRYRYFTQAKGRFCI
jgi:hypothetical protein